MTNQSNQINKNTSSPNNSCLKATGISCLVITVTFIGLAFWIYSALSKSPIFKNVYKDANKMVVCLQQLDQLGGALDRYSQKNGKYPQKLDELYPTFLETKTVLHCPADPGPADTVSYEYKVPDKKALGTTVVVVCNRHTMINSPVSLRLQKDGTIKQYTSTSSIGVEVKPKRAN